MRRSSIAMLAALSALLVFPVAVPAAGVVEIELDQRPGQVSRYWTPERMAAARPIEELLAQRSGVRSPQPQSHGTPDRTEIPNTTAYPARVHGKAFFTIPSGPYAGDYVCSGTAVGSPAGNVVITAGHCVYDDATTGGDVAVTNFQFVPGYRNGNTPFGAFAGTAVYADSAWMQDGDLRFDVGAVVVAGGPSGSLERTVGARGIAFNQKRSQFFRSYGYPATSPFDGQLLYRCDSEFGGSDSSSEFFPGPYPMVIRCDMTQGSSGGGWVIDDLFVNSVNSYKYSGSGGAEDMYGPYFGDVARAVYESAAGNLACGGLDPTHVGTAGDDVIHGTPGRDVIIALGGDDIIDGGGGDDLICAGEGDDTLSGGPGDDHLIGEGGNDTADFSGAASSISASLAGALATGEGIDTLTSVENLIGSNHPDELTGNAVRNRIDGGRRGDEIDAGDGDDIVLGGRGGDRVRSGAGEDRVRGGRGDDELRGNPGDDRLGGGPGDDRLAGGNGFDTCRGGPGSDAERRCEA